jgi:hypothetical protein
MSMVVDQQIEFVPTVSAEWREAVEELFFFNPRQSLFRDAIRESVEHHGVPEILERDGRIWIGVASGTTQCLFACDRSREPRKPAGVVVYARPALDTLSIVHLAVGPEYGLETGDGEAGLGVLLVETVRRIARRMNGIVQLQLPYRARCYLPVAPGRSQPDPGQAGEAGGCD